MLHFLASTIKEPRIVANKAEWKSQPQESGAEAVVQKLMKKAQGYQLGFRV